MMQEEASALGVHLRALVEAPDGSTAQVVVDAPVGRADDAGAVRALVEGTGEPGPGAGAARLQAAGRADALTFEHEHQDSALLERLQAEGVSVQPTAQALLLARDKLAMRRAMDEAGLLQPAWAEVGGEARVMVGQVRAFGDRHGWPVVLKTPRGGYDGHGVLLVEGPEELADDGGAGSAESDGGAAAWIAGVAAARGEAVPTLVTDTTGRRVHTATAADAARAGLYAQLLNPAWVEAMLAHGHQGVGEIAERTTNLLGLAATTGEMADWMFDAVCDRFLGDPEMLRRLREANPHATAAIAGRLLEANRRDLWQACEERIDTLENVQFDTDAGLEGAGETGA